MNMVCIIDIYSIRYNTYTVDDNESISICIKTNASLYLILITVPGLTTYLLTTLVNRQEVIQIYARKPNQL